MSKQRRIWKCGKQANGFCIFRALIISSSNPFHVRHGTEGGINSWYNDSDSDQTLVEEESSSDESNTEESDSSEGDSWEAEWGSSSASYIHETEDTTNNSTGTPFPPPGVITSNVHEMEDTISDSTGNVSRPRGMISRPISFNTRITLPAQEADELVHPGNRIFWEEELGNEGIPGGPRLNPDPAPVRKRRRSPSTSSDEEIVILRHMRPRSPSIEIISYIDRIDVLHARVAAARRERRRLFMEEALRTDGFVFTGFRIV